MITLAGLYIPRQHFCWCLISLASCLEAGVTGLHLYDGIYIKSRSVRGAFFDVIEALDPDMFQELLDNDATWVHAKYFGEDEDG